MSSSSTVASAPAERLWLSNPSLSLLLPSQEPVLYFVLPPTEFLIFRECPMQARKFLIFLLVSVLCATAFSQTGSQDDYTAKRQKAIQLFNQNKELEALPLFEELAAANPKDADVLLGLAAGLVSHSATVDDAAATKDRIRARELLLKAKELGQHSNLLENLLQMLPPDGKMNYSQDPADQAMKEGEAAFAKKDFPAAIKAYSKVLELQPKNYSAALYIGDSYFGAQDFSHAGEWYERAIQTDPD